MVEAPIEFFHSALAWLRGAPTGSLWGVLEEDPAIYQRDAISTAWNSPQLSDLAIDTYTRLWLLVLGAAHTAAAANVPPVPGSDFCAGYFKWPTPEYSCTGVKLLFSNLLAAVEEIEDDLPTFAAPTC